MVPETSVINYHYWLRDIPEERSSHLLSGGTLKSRSDQLVLMFSIPKCCYIQIQDAIR